MKRFARAAAAAGMMLSIAAPNAVQATDLAVRDAWARATPPGAGVGAAYLTIVGGDRPDQLVSASSDIAAMTQIHAVTQTAGVARMREADGVDIPAGKSVVFAPQGLHLMLMNLQRPLVAGQKFEVRLVFEHAGTRVVHVSVVAPDETPPTPHAH